MNRVFISLIVVFAALAAVLVVQATRESSAIVLLPSDLASAPTTDRSRIRVGGRVADLPIVYETEPKIKLTFQIHNPGVPSAPETVSVVYEGIKPDMFAAGRDVIIDGDYKGGVLYAARLLTQCPSKYEPPKPTASGK